jgi:hypothetical protein
VQESPSFPRCVYHDPQPTPLVVQSSKSGWTAAPPPPESANQTSGPDQSKSAPPPAKDDIVGWPDEILIDFADSTDRALD